MLYRYMNGVLSQGRGDMTQTLEHRVHCDLFEEYLADV